MQTDLTEILDHYQNIPPLDLEQVDLFYNKYKIIFDNNISESNAFYSEYVGMLAEIANTYALNNKFEIALPLLKRVETSFIKMKVNPKNSWEYNAVLKSFAFIYFSKRAFAKALVYYEQIQFENENTDKLLNDLYKDYCEQEVNYKKSRWMEKLGMSLVVLAILLRVTYNKFPFLIILVSGSGLVLILLSYFRHKKPSIKKLETIVRIILKEKIEWQGDLKDDCSAHWQGLLLRAECLDNNQWWWSVYDLQKKEIQIDSSNERDEIVTDAEAARTKAEFAAQQYIAKKLR